jgi:predicted enzyme related to lactoylglutathione lyase
MFNQLNYAMVTVSDMGRSVAFYRDKLGLQLRTESPGWSEFNTGTTTLALHGGGKPADRHNTGGAPAAGTCTIGFNVDDLERVYNELTAIGVRFVMSPTLRQEEGIKLAVCVDPDGFQISIAEMIHTWA